MKTIEIIVEGEPTPAWCDVCLLSCAWQWTLNVGTFTECPECGWNPIEESK